MTKGILTDDIRRHARGASEGDNEAFEELQRLLKRNNTYEADGVAGWVIVDRTFIPSYYQGEGEGWGSAPKLFRSSFDARKIAGNLSLVNDEKHKIFIYRAKFVLFDFQEVTKKTSPDLGDFQDPNHQYGASVVGRVSRRLAPSMSSNVVRHEQTEASSQDFRVVHSDRLANTPPENSVMLTAQEMAAPPEAAPEYPELSVLRSLLRKANLFLKGLKKDKEPSEEGSMLLSYLELLEGLELSVEGSPEEVSVLGRLNSTWLDLSPEERDIVASWAPEEDS